MAEQQKEKEYISREKYKDIEGELNQLRTTKRKEIASQLEYAKSLGDLSENAEYQEARDEQAKTEDRIAYLEHILRNAEVVSDKRGDTVSVGSTVVLQKKGSDKSQTFIVVGVEESDLLQGKISVKSPIGQAIHGKKKGETVVAETPNGEKTYTIKDIS